MMIHDSWCVESMMMPAFGVIWMLMMRSMMRLMMRLAMMMISTISKSGYAGKSSSSKQCHSIWTKLWIQNQAILEILRVFDKPVYQPNSSWGVPHFWQTGSSWGDTVENFLLLASTRERCLQIVGSYLLFVIFFTRAKFLETKFYTQKRVNIDKTDFATK